MVSELSRKGRSGTEQGSSLRRHEFGIALAAQCFQKHFLAKGFVIAQQVKQGIVHVVTLRAVRVLLSIPSVGRNQQCWPNPRPAGQELYEVLSLTAWLGCVRREFNSHAARRVH